MFENVAYLLFDLKTKPVPSGVCIGGSGGARVTRDACLTPFQFFFIFLQFSAKIMPNNRSAPPFGLAPHLRNPGFAAGVCVCARARGLFKWGSQRSYVSHHG